MRVISGIRRGKNLVAPVGSLTRPTSDRVKEALFNILAHHLDFTDITLLDLCAGSGALGIEALSRGASFCTFVEMNPAVKPVLEKNLSSTGFLGQAQLIIKDIISALPMLARQERRYELVFFDPPYASELYDTVLVKLSTSDIFVPGALIVAECSSRMTLTDSFGSFTKVDRRVYGETALEMYVLEDS